MRVGTKSLLFGVHQILIHPTLVALAWRKLYRKWPRWHETVCIFCHDLGYWGKPNMDGQEGKTHPEGGAHIASWIIYRLRRLSGWTKVEAQRDADLAYDFCICHSSFYAKAIEQEPSSLYYADKASVLHEPRWFYLLRAKASGEVWEYIDVALKSKVWSDEWNVFFGMQSRARQARLWHNWYQNKTRLRMQRIKV